MSESKHTPGLMKVDADLGNDQIHIIIDRTAVARVMVKSDGEGLANAARLALCWNTHDALVAIVARLTLATDEHDDKAMGTHYVDKAGVIRCKGSFLELVEAARAALALVEGA